MQTRLIELLKNSVSSIVLDGETDYLIEKNRALNDFYPVFLSVLRHRPSHCCPTIFHKRKLI